MHPTISIIIPAFNEERTLSGLLTALARQTYPAALTEIIVVDNRSTDATAQVAAQAGVTVLREDRLPSSDLARNTGIRHATGEVLLFTDGDCLPEPDWAARLVAAVATNKPTLAAGHIVMDLPAQPSAGAVYDSMSFLKHENAVLARKIAFTANLAVSREVALAVGGIPLDSVTCGDAYFARLCHHFGCDMVYVPEAVVHHPVRDFRQLARKVRLIARANALAGDKDRRAPRVRQVGYLIGWRALTSMPHLRALWPHAISRHLAKHGVRPDPWLVGRTWVVALLILAYGALVYLQGLGRAKVGSRRDSRRGLTA